jgi:hypothetical protein
LAAGDVQRAAERTGQLVDALTETFAGELAQVLTLLRHRIRQLVKKLETDETGRVVATRANLQRALALRTDIRRALEAAGYRNLANAALDVPLDRLAASVLRGIDGPGPITVPAQTLAAVRRVRFDQLLNVGADIANVIWRTVLDGVTGSRSLVDLVDDIADALEISARQARSIYDTALSIYSRQAAQGGTTGEPDELFFYVGPVDTRVRPFCMARVGKVYTREAIDAMDNGQLPNVMSTGGGYNCRHMFQRVSRLDQELIDLAGTNDRHPAVTRRMADTPAIGRAA